MTQAKKRGKREGERRKKERRKERERKEWKKEEKRSKRKKEKKNSPHLCKWPLCWGTSSMLSHLQLKLSVNFELVLSLKLSYSESLVYSQVFPKHVSCPGHVWQTMSSFSKESLSLDFPLRLSTYLLFASSAIFLLQGAVDQSLAFQWFWEMPNA